MDESFFRAINGLAERSAVVDWLMLALAQSSNLFLPGVLVFGYWLWIDKREALVGSAALAGVIVVNDFLGAQVKHLVARPRPCRVLDHIHELAGCGGTFSFPSNHAMNTAAAAAFAQMLYPASGWVTWPLVALIGFSRVYVGAHYVTDVLGAWILGAGGGFLAGWLLLRWSTFSLNRMNSKIRSAWRDV